jgi:hypothetical protein
VVEIKSTLDIVLEKTKHLSLSETEKREQERAEAAKKLNGVLQKYQDAKLGLTQVKQELDRLKSTHAVLNDQTLCAAMLQRIQLGQDNERCLALVQDCCPLDTARLQSVLKDYDHALQSAADRRSENIKKKLQQDHFISGSAVMPNLNADRQWATEQEALRSKYPLRPLWSFF